MWSQLPNEILVTILLKSSLIDRIRAGSVCISWWSALKEIKKLKLQTSGLLLLSKNLETDIHTVLDLSNNTIYGGIHIPETHEVFYLGSFHGWLILSKWFTRNIFLFNPSTKEQIKLPFRANIWHLDDNNIYRVKDFTSHRIPHSSAILSSAPTSDNCMVLIVDANNLFGFCRRGDARWTVIKEVPFDDVTWYKGRVYFIRRRYHRKIWKLLQNPNFGGWKGLTIKVVEIEKDYNGYQAYLVESCGELLMVLKLRRRHGSRKKFCVFKMDERGRFSIKVESLGDQMLFVGKRCSKSFSATKLSGFEENCIYYSDDHTGKFSVFHMKDGSIKPCFPTWYFQHILRPFIWLMS
ncbi:F-box protein At2g26160-like [Magnolia sinica]|uniref:F-box protein At2g26160-like n=1 Tax=Magnolia sinica TaxID=86752 RepID=UPI00265A06A9|nr:F-box protein At2g26160-like [Magnolia sinica]